MRRVVNRVNEEVSADGAREAERAPRVRQRAQSVRGRADGDDPCARADFRLEVVPVERARLCVHTHDAQDYLALALKRLPRRDVGVMIQLRDDDLVARRERSTKRARDVVGERRRVRAEDDLRRRCAEEVGYAAARALDQLVRLGARRVGPVRVGVVMIKVVAYGLDDCARNLRAAGAVEVCDGASFVLASERGEVRPDLFGREHVGVVIQGRVGGIGRRRVGGGL